MPDLGPALRKRVKELQEDVDTNTASITTLQTVTATKPINGAANPTGVVPPTFIGQLFIDVNTGITYIATGLTSADWSAL